MTENERTPGSALELDDRLPVRWRVDSPGESSTVRLANEETLRLILSLDDHHVDLPDDSIELAQEFQRLESKLNLILDLLGRVVARQMDVPPAQPVRLTASFLEWSTDEPPATGTRGWLEVYLCNRFPQPVQLPAVVESVSATRVRAAFVDPGEVVQDHLETLIFRHHRRQVAAARRAAGSG